jgi:hypothetical protein
MVTHALGVLAVGGLLIGCGETFAPPLQGRFVDVALDVEPFTFPAPDPTAAHDPPLTSGVFLGGDDLVFASQGSNDPSIVYHYADGVLHRVGTHSPVYDVVDLDGDGQLDMIDDRSIEWGGGGMTQLGANLFHGGITIDLDGDGILDLVSNHSDCPEAPTAPVQAWRQVAPRHLVDARDLFDPSTPPLSARLWTGMIRGELVLAVLGWGCNPRAQIPIFFHREGGIWRHFDAPCPGCDLPEPMGAALLDGDLFVTLHPEHGLIHDGRRIDGDQPWRIQTSPTGEPMIPWDILLIDLDGDGRKDAIWSHGADEFWSAEVRAIGPQHVTAWRNGPDGWARWEATGLERGGQWKRMAQGILDGHLAILVGGFGERPRVYRFEP